MRKASGYKPLSTEAIRKFWDKLDQANTIRYSDAEAIQKAFDAGHNIGESEGRRLERAASHGRKGKGK